jgi:hypothetical protein
MGAGAIEDFARSVVDDVLDVFDVFISDLIVRLTFGEQFASPTDDLRATSVLVCPVHLIGVELLLKVPRQACRLHPRSEVNVWSPVPLSSVRSASAV